MSKLINKIWKEQDKFLSQFDTIKIPRGGLDKNGAEALEFLFKKIAKKNVNVLEIGCWTGCSSIILGNLVKKYKGQLTCIDWFKGNPNANLDIAEFANIKNIFAKNIMDHDLVDYINLIEGTSNWDHNLPYQNFDMIFIDGDHRYKNVLDDIKVWSDMVRPGGILCGHDCEYLISGYDDLFKQTEDVDYTQCHTGVIRAVYEMFGTKANLTEKGYIWWIKK